MEALTVARRLPGLRRAWPRADGSMTAELVDPAGGVDQRLRAVRISAQGVVEQLPYATDPALPGLSPRLPGRLVVHRAGRRAVVLQDDRALKLLRPGRATDLPPGAAQAFGAIGLRTAPVLESGRDHLATALLPGRTLHELGDDGAAGWARLAELWPGLAGAPTTLPAHGPRQEAEVLERWLALALRHGALDRPGTLTGEVHRACARLVDGRPDPPVAAHRDLHDKQLLWDGSRVSLLDLDTAACAEPALDLGNLMAHVDLMGLTGALSQDGWRTVLDLLDGVATAMAVRTERLRVYTHASRLRLVCVHAFRPGSRSWLAAWLEQSLSAQGGRFLEQGRSGR
ncbi:phosphotransferase family protein [Actinomyces howellii]|uniref:Phosphotransferase enzyme family n=1 Tax=Actinomyces howellii TaxID=52771 RepID=A0A448HDC4_9ACTO|nr:serine kinase [Actinomyces howellii]VEG25623.1 Uncharacterised protein [Actinomyces howellii]